MLSTTEMVATLKVPACTSLRLPRRPSLQWLDGRLACCLHVGYEWQHHTYAQPKQRRESQVPTWPEGLHVDGLALDCDGQALEWGASSAGTWVALSVRFEWQHSSNSTRDRERIPTHTYTHTLTASKAKKMCPLGPLGQKALEGLPLDS